MLFEVPVIFSLPISTGAPVSSAGSAFCTVFSVVCISGLLVAGERSTVSVSSALSVRAARQTQSVRQPVYTQKLQNLWI